MTHTITRTRTAARQPAASRAFACSASAIRAFAFSAFACSALALTAAAGSAGAQTLSEQTATLTGPSRFISTNPFLPLFGFFSAEYEQRIKENVAFAVAASHVKYDDRYTHLDAKLRLYPNDRALEGFSLASSLGLAWIKRDRDDLYCIPIGSGSGCPGRPDRTFTTPSFAVELGYQWLLGRSRSTAITAGFGVKRYLGGSKSDFDGIQRVLPTGRISIGYGF